MFISIQRYGADWLINPRVLILFAFAALSLCAPLLQNVRQRGGWMGMATSFHRPVWKTSQLFPILLIVTLVVLMFQMTGWTSAARIVPTVVVVGALLFCSASLVTVIFGDVSVSKLGLGNRAKEAEIAHFDIANSLGDMPAAQIIRRGLIFFGWLVAFMISMAAIGLIPTVPIFIVALRRIEGRERWTIVLPMAIIMTVFIWFLFDRMLAVPWPGSYLGEVFDWWKDNIPSA